MSICTINRRVKPSSDWAQTHDELGLNPSESRLNPGFEPYNYAINLILYLCF